MSSPTFGGQWTEEKLKCLTKYLEAYRTIFTVNEKAKFFRTWYVDAFAGSGERIEPVQPIGDRPLFSEVYEETVQYREGSVRKALSLHSPFDHYLFIEQSHHRISQLRQVIHDTFNHMEPRCDLKQGDANTVLKEWCSKRDWKKERAVVFLDPYGMQVEWQTIEMLAATKAVDLWYLFPLGVGVSRLLPKNGNIPLAWQARLNLLFGTDEWHERFYKTVKQHDLFGINETLMRAASVEKISDFIHERLKSCFAGVAEGLILENSRASPLYLLCFAAANKSGATIACKIAQSILNDQ